MRIQQDQLEQQLKRTLAPVYIVSGDDPLLLREAADTVREACRAAGFESGERANVEAGFNWPAWLDGCNSLSLFAERKLIELRMPQAKPGDSGGKVLQAYAESPNPDNVLLITTGKLDGDAQRAKWFKALDAAGVFVPVWPIDAQRLPGWVEQRARRAGLNLSRDAARLLAERVEGNLLAAVQELEKLRLAGIDAQIGADDIIALVSNHARYTVFDLADRVLAGNAANALTVLRGLQSEGVEPAAVLWSLCRELRLVTALRRQTEQGVNIEQALRNQRNVWEKRKPLLRQAVKRSDSRVLAALFPLAQRIDRAIKGMDSASPWDLLTELSLKLAGVPRLAVG